MADVGQLLEARSLIEALAAAILVFVGATQMLDLCGVTAGRGLVSLDLGGQRARFTRWREVEEILGGLLSQLPEERRRRLFELVARTSRAT